MTEDDGSQASRRACSRMSTCWTSFFGGVGGLGFKGLELKIKVSGVGGLGLKGLEIKIYNSRCWGFGIKGLRALRA